MVIALVGLALAMIAGGAWAALQGYDIITQERGWTLLIAGVTVASVGMVLLGITTAVARLGAIRGELAHLRERADRPQPNYPDPPSHIASPGASSSSGVASAQVEGNGQAVLGTYSAGGNRYVMFADGSVEAETAEGTFRFRSFDDLKASMAPGGGSIQRTA